MLVRLAVPGLARWSVIHIRDCDGGIRQLAAAHLDPVRARTLRDVGRRWPPHASGMSGIARALLDARGSLVPRTSDSSPAEALGLTTESAELTTALGEIGVASVVIAPVAIGEGITAAITWGRGDDEAPFDSGDMALLTALASHVAPTLVFAYRASREEQARAEADAARQHLTNVLDELPDGFLSLDRDWRITYLNVAAMRLWQGSRSAALGRTLWDVVRVPATSPVREECERAMRDGIPTESELCLPEQGRWLSARAVPGRAGLSIYLRDVTGRRAADEERERLLAEADAARAAAELANQAKTDFLAVMSHELRTPLNAVLGYVSLLADEISGPLVDAQRQQLSRVRASASHLLALIEEVLSFARLEAGTETVRAEQVDAVALARDAAHLVEPVIEAQGLRFVVDYGTAARPIRTDARKIRQILLNLLANAARFTAAGGTVSLTVGSADDYVTLAVRDTGIGIAPEHHERIFESFWQVEQTLTRRTGGVGLGLSVSRRLARLLGGDVTVKSAPGAGSTFVVALPLDVPPREDS